MTTTELRAHCEAQAAHPTWQHELRQSVRLLLALAEPGLNTHALHAALALVEDELRRQLLAGHPAATAPQATATAQQVLHRRQQALLAQASAHAALRHDWPVTEFARPLRRTCRPPAIGWRLAA